MKTKILLFLVLAGAAFALPPPQLVRVDPIIAQLEDKAEAYEYLASLFTYEISPELNAAMRARAKAFREAIAIVRKATYESTASLRLVPPSSVIVTKPVTVSAPTAE